MIFSVLDETSFDLFISNNFGIISTDLTAAIFFTSY